MVVNVEGLTVKYRDLTAVDNISFSVNDGEIFGIIGPNGAGKTSAIECIEGLRKYASGSLSVLGISPENRRQLYSDIGVQLQEASFPDTIKVEEVCKLFSSFYAAPADYNALLGRFGLQDKKHSFVKKLSGGQKQKLSIIVALISNPKIIFLDELTTGLDPASRRDMWELIKSLNAEGKTIIMTTHYMEEAQYLCSRVMVMVKGKIAALGTVQELLRQFEIPQKITFNSPDISKINLSGIGGVSEVKISDNSITVGGTGSNLLRDVTLYLTKENIAFSDLSGQAPGLEDVYFKLTGQNPEVK
jgi:ABC-type multidrug transport system, ATPase component